MTSFWAGWVMAYVVINYGVIFLLYLWAPVVDIPTDADGTTGHSWSHGMIKEGLHNLPKWWLITSGLSFLFAFIYLVLYPGFGNHQGVFGWSSTIELHEHIANNNEKMVDLVKKIDETSVLALAKDEDSMKLGQRLYEDNCAVCHGFDGQGSQLIGAPVLTDNTWLYGGKVSDVIQTITHGRNGVMPGWVASIGEGGVLKVSNYVLSLSGLTHNEKAAAEGEKIFASTCVACHGAEGKGNPMLGAPDLTDNDWLYGSSLTSVAESVRNGRSGKMPAWNDRLNEQQIKVLAAWVLSHDNTEAAIAAGDK